jgi:hypothetical protein
MRRAMAVYMHRNLVEGIDFAVGVSSLVLLWENPISRYSYQMMMALLASISLMRALSLEELLDGGGKEASKWHRESHNLFNMCT